MHVPSELRLLMLSAAVLCCAASASAHERPGALYAFGGIGAFHQPGPTGESPQTYVSAPGGTARGWLIGGGVFLTTAVSLDVELSSTGWMRAREPSRYDMTFNEERRDRFVSVSTRFHLPRMAAVRVEPVVGLVVTRPEAWSQTEYYRYWLPPEDQRTTGPRLQHHLDTAVGFAVGCDVRIGGRRAALLPSFRLADTAVSHGFYDDSPDHREIDSIYPGGYPKWTARASLAVRIDF